MLEREYNVPLRREFLKAPRYKRTNRAVSALKTFISRHMKSDDVSLGKHLNNKLWENGIKNPPGKVAIKVTKDDSGKVMAELKDVPKIRPKVNKRLARVERSENKKPEKEEEQNQPTSKADKTVPKAADKAASEDKAAQSKTGGEKSKSSETKETSPKTDKQKKDEPKKAAADESSKEK
ncbi:MAG: 50S ribosomal protein L31e [Candidatus Woesearchaeota archaeon]